MKRIFSFFCSLVMLSSLTSCTKTDNAANATDKVNIAELNQKFVGAWNNRQQDSLIAMLAEDVHFLQGDVHYNGKSEVSDKWIRKTIGTISNLRTSAVSSGADTEIAYEAGTFQVDVPAQQANEPNAMGEGNFTLLWKKQANGKWKLSLAQLEDNPLRVK